MADVWVLHRTPEDRRPGPQSRKARSRMVRIDTALYLSATEDEVRAQWQPGSEVLVTLAARKDGDEPLPFDFQLGLLVAAAAARETCEETGEDQVLVAELYKDAWSWKTLPALRTGLTPPPAEYSAGPGHRHQRPGPAARRCAGHR
ncbi:hypothetical protein ACFW95_37235 [Streptomyces sp. NPDC059474]|uniref:hypothetical protein n=1 Tax=Streptomyces sp. NPDC059474 TaxID=3346846 RepID=UPI00368812EF